MTFLQLVLFMACALKAMAEVTVLKSSQVIYDRSPKLRIKGSGFDAEDHDIVIEIGASNSPALRPGKDYLLTKSAEDDGIILKLLGNRK